MNEHFLTDIEIKQFKCFTDFKASGFKRVNLIGGKNNIGKTALMEACYINVCAQKQNIQNLIAAIVVIKGQREKANLVHQNKMNYQDFLDSTKNYKVESNLDKQEFLIIEQGGKKEYKFIFDKKTSIVNSNNINISINLPQNIKFIDNFGWSDGLLIKAYQAIQKQDKENELNNFVNEFDNGIETFKVIGEKPQCKTNEKYRDINEFGDGLKHYISIICALYACENGYLFIDEIDNGIYYEHFDRLWEIILTLSKQTNCQVFATTHSKEMLESFARVSKKLDEQDISFTTLVKNKEGKIKALTRDYEMLLDSIEDEREVR